MQLKGMDSVNEEEYEQLKDDEGDCSCILMHLILFLSRKDVVSCGKAACTKAVAAQPQQKTSNSLYQNSIVS